MTSGNNTTHGIIGEFDSAAALMKAAEKMRDSEYRKFDCHSPFPIHGMDDAMGLKRSPLGFMVAMVAFVATTGGLYLQYWTNAVDYPLIISGKPFVSYQAYAPVGFGIAVLLSAFTAFFGMLALNKLPQLFHPVFFSDRFKKATDDGFFISIEAGDPAFSPEKTQSFLESIGAKNVEELKSS